MTECLEDLVPWMYASLFLNIGLSTIVIVVNLALFYLLHFRQVAVGPIDEANGCFLEAMKAAEFARMPAAGVFVLAQLANDKGGISREDVLREYEKDSMERRAIVYDVFGQNPTTRRFVDHFRSQFLRSGYADEQQLLAAFEMEPTVRQLR